jgi:hypothetical protein
VRAKAFDHPIVCPREPVRVDGHPIVGPLTLSASARVEIGYSVLTVCPGDLTAAGRGVDPAGGVGGKIILAPWL